MTKWLGTQERRARAGHACALCYGQIAIGETYSDTVAVEEGAIYHFRAHLACTALVEGNPLLLDDEGLVQEGILWECDLDSLDVRDDVQRDRVSEIRGRQAADAAQRKVARDLRIAGAAP